MHANGLNLGWNFEQKNGHNPESDSKTKSKDNTERAVGGKIRYATTKPLENDIKKAIATLQEASHMVKDISKTLNVRADTVHEVLKCEKEQGSATTWSILKPMLAPCNPLVA